MRIQRAAIFAACLLTWITGLTDLNLMAQGQRPERQIPSLKAEDTTVNRIEGYRGPIDLVVAEDEAWAATVNELSHSVSLIDLRSSRVVDEMTCSARPSACVRLSGDELLVSCRDDGVVQRILVQRQDGVPIGLKPIAQIETGFQPLGMAVDLARQRAFVGLIASGEVAEIDLIANAVRGTFPVGQWPRYLTLTPDGKRLAVGLSGESKVAVFDSSTGQLEYEEPLSGGINLGHMRCSADGLQVYFPWMIYRSNPIDVGNIRRGWVLASRIGRVRLDGPAYREAISLDVPKLAVADPHGLAITPDEKTMVVTSSGTHELLVYRVADMPFVGAGGPGDLIDAKLLRNREAFFRIELGGRPMGVEAARDNRTVYISNHTLDSLQIVDLATGHLRSSISLGAPPNDTQQQLVHLGLEIFHDAGRSLDQWYSCRSCHLDGGSNAKAMDTWNDGSSLTAKTVLPLMNVTATGPWTWHGWQTDLDESIQNSFESTMQGQPGSVDDVAAVRAYLASLSFPRNPFRHADNKNTLAIGRGEALFRSSQVGCANCHAGAEYSDGEIHDVGLAGDSDRYSGFNTPSLVGVYQKVRLLHDGRSKSLRDVLTTWHTPAEIGGGAELSQQQLDDLISFLKTL